MSVWERSWNMNAGSNGLKKTQFSLERHQTDGIVYYTMKIEKLGAAADASEAEAWSNCRLVQRGLYPMPWAPVKSLKPFDGTDITASIDEWLERVSAVTLRLEGELEIVGEPADKTKPSTAIPVTPMAVTMFVAKDAVDTRKAKKRDLLLVRIRSTGAGTSIVGGPDGTGHGDPT